MDIIKCDEQEVFLDIGAYDGDTAKSYIETYGKENYKKIYCYEITPNVFKKLKENTKMCEKIEYRMKGVSDKIGKASFETNGENSSNRITDNDSGDIIITTIDEDIDENVTFIKMDIEGSEKNALKGCTNQIKNNHPKLAISIYHNNEDIWKIAKQIKEMDPSYKFYIRYYGGNLYPSEYVLYGI